MLTFPVKPRGWFWPPFSQYVLPAVLIFHSEVRFGRRLAKLCGWLLAQSELVEVHQVQESKLDPYEPGRW